MKEETIIVDSNLSLAQVLKQKQEMPAPKEILNRQRIVEIYYYSFDGKLHKGQIVVDESLVGDVKGAFNLIKKEEFPIYSVIPMSDRRFMSDDEKSMSLNNSSGFNYRRIAKSKKLSNHAFGRAIDINPMQNPYIRPDYSYPKGVDYNPNVPGTITRESAIYKFLKERGWVWGGEWTDRKDYMHFEKPLKNQMQYLDNLPHVR